MPKIAPPEIRRELVERAARMLARREPVTLRSLVAGTGVSTMSVYTHFDGMPGLWRAVRQEGFTRLAARLAQVRESRDPVRHSSALGAAYVQSALDAPDLYRVMFDAAFDLEDPAAADATFGVLIAALERARAVGRLSASAEPPELATRQWIIGHGLTSLALNGVLDRASLEDHAVALVTALFVDAGDDPDRCRRSVRAGWRAEFPRTAA